MTRAARRRKAIAAPLETSHWPPAQRCPHCRRTAAYHLAGVTWCVSSACDPRGLTWRALDRYFREHPTIDNNSERL